MIDTLDVLEKYGFRFQKKYGQNFLTDLEVLRNIMDAADITKEDFVLEIGPGIGTMTQFLCERAREVMAVEIDATLIPILKETLRPYENLTIVNEDILKVDLEKISREKNAGKPIKVVANLPYYITTPILMQLFFSRVPMESITVMVQKEVAARMQAGPGSKDYGALSLAVQYFTEPKVMTIVPPESFIPAPKVASAVIRLTFHKEGPVKVENEKFFFAVIRASFNQRRKTLANGLKNSPEIPLNREAILSAIQKAGFEENIRGEKLTLEEFARLSSCLLEEIPSK